MAQTERITFLATKDFKKWLATEAKKSGLSISELIRLRCESVSSEDIITLKASVNELKIATASLSIGSGSARKFASSSTR